MSIDERVNDNERGGFFEKFSTSGFFRAVRAASLGTFLYFSSAFADINLTVKTENKQKGKAESSVAFEFPDYGVNEVTNAEGIANVRLIPTSVPADNTRPSNYELKQNYPNPFNPETIIRYEVKKAGRVRIDVYNILGQKVRTLVNEVKNPGFYSARWDGRNERGMGT